VCGLAEDLLLLKAVACERGSCAEFSSWIGSGQQAMLFYEKFGDIWGLALMNNILVESVIPFSSTVERNMETTL
jgi:hypothetical protein